MSNEEIVTRIQAGDRDMMGTLWEQVEKLVAWKARRVINVLNGMGSVTFGDLYNSGYLALVAAVETYNPDSGAFSTWLMYYLKTAFAAATGFRTKRSKNDPLHTAVSLSSPVGDDSDAGELEEMIPDPRSKYAFEMVEDQIWYQQLCEAMDSVLAELPEDQKTVLQHRYYSGQTLAATGAALGISAEEVRKLENKGIRSLRHPKNAKRIRPFLDFDYYMGTGLGAYQNTGLSIQERYLIRQERAEKERNG